MTLTITDSNGLEVRRTQDETFHLEEHSSYKIRVSPDEQDVELLLDDCRLARGEDGFQLETGFWVGFLILRVVHGELRSLAEITLPSA